MSEVRDNSVSKHKFERGLLAICTKENGSGISHLYPFDSIWLPELITQVQSLHGKQQDIVSNQGNPQSTHKNSESFPWFSSLLKSNYAVDFVEGKRSLRVNFDSRKTTTTTRAILMIL